MEEKKYQVFVSSTYTDLIQHRKKVIETVLSLYHFPVGMEMFSADDSEQWEIIKETIDVSDYYVIIIGHRYGSLSENGLSYTEMEYDYAKTLGIPILAFIQNRDVSLRKDEREQDPESSKKLDVFIEKAKSNKMCDFWDNIHDLATKVAIALPKVMRRTPRPGWSRENDIDSQQISHELARLSAENSDLRNQLEKYKSRDGINGPKLKVKITEETEINFNLSFSNEREKKPKPIDFSALDAELKNFVTSAEVREFNRSIPSDEDLRNYYNERHIYINKRENSKPISLKISNMGSKPATDINIFMTIPEFLKVVTFDKFDDMLEPEIAIPTSPLIAARKKMKSIKSTGKKINLRAIYDESLFFPLVPQRRVNSYTFQENQLDFKIPKLLQHLQSTLADYFLIPISHGEGEIVIQLVCEELAEISEYTIPVRTIHS